MTCITYNKELFLTKRHTICGMYWLFKINPPQHFQTGQHTVIHVTNNVILQWKQWILSITITHSSNKQCSYEVIYVITKYMHSQNELLRYYVNSNVGRKFSDCCLHIVFDWVMHTPRQHLDILVAPVVYWFSRYRLFVNCSFQGLYTSVSVSGQLLTDNVTLFSCIENVVINLSPISFHVFLRINYNVNAIRMFHCWKYII